MLPFTLQELSYFKIVKRSIVTHAMTFTGLSRLILKNGGHGIISVTFFKQKELFKSSLIIQNKLSIISRPILLLELIMPKRLLNSANYRECIKVLEKVNILPQEGAQEGHDIFELANLSLAVELLETRKNTERRLSM